MILQIRPTAKQVEAYRYLLDKQTTYVLYGGAAGGGKSFLGSEWIIGMCISYPGTIWFIGRENLNDLRIYTTQSIYEVFAVRLMKASDYFRFNAQDNIFYFHNGSVIKYLDLKVKPGDPYFESLGSTQFTGGWIEEAAQVKFAAFDTLKARIGRWKNDEYGLQPKMLLTCNPAKNWLYEHFYKPWKESRLPKDKVFIQALVTDNNFAQKSFSESLDQISDKVRRQRLRFGNWEYDSDENCLMDGDAIRDIFTNDHVPPGDAYITADIARFGKDTTVIALWSGLRLESMTIMKMSSVTESAAKIKELSILHRVQMSKVIVDEDGVGGGVKDILKCMGFVNNSMPVLQAGIKPNYQNLKSQCYYVLSEVVNKGGVYVKCEDTAIQEMIIDEMEQVKKKNPDGDGKLAVIPKDEVKQVLGRSPDFSDCVMMRIFYELNPPFKIFHRTR